MVSDSTPSKCAYQEAYRDLDRALGDFVKSRKGQRKGRRLGFPRFKKRGKCKDSFRFGSGVMRCSGTTVTLPRIHARVADIRADVLHKAAADLAARYETIVAEDLNVAGGEDVTGMRFAIKTRPEHQTWEEIRDAWIAADEIPLFESAWNWDHFYPLTGDLTGPNFEAWTMLAAMAQATRRIRIGCQVTGMVYRHPAVLANMAATVDIISGGRLELGLGAAWNQMECDAYGIDLPPLRERFDLFDEGVEAIVRLLSQTTTTFAGQYVRLTDARCEPKPVQRPHPPVTIGGRGKKRTLRTVARWAQQWNAIAESPEQWLELKEVLAGHCAAIGRDVNEITCSVNVRIDPDTGLEPVIATAAAYRDAGAHLIIVNLPHHAKPDSLKPLAEALRPLG